MVVLCDKCVLCGTLVIYSGWKCLPATHHLSCFIRCQKTHCFIHMKHIQLQVRCSFSLKILWWLHGKLADKKLCGTKCSLNLNVMMLSDHTYCNGHHRKKILILGSSNTFIWDEAGCFWFLLSNKCEPSKNGN